MNFRNLLRNKSLVIAVSAMVVVFLLFLAAITVIQANSVSFIRHADTANGIVQRFDSGLYDSNLGVLSCLLYTSPSPRDQRGSRMPSSA